MMSPVTELLAVCFVTAVLRVGIITGTPKVERYPTDSGQTEPVPICQVYNWEKMTCTWQEPNNETAHHLVYISKHFDSVSNLKQCPERSRDRSSGDGLVCQGSLCTINETNFAGIFQAKFCIYAVNSRTKETSTKQAFDALQIVKPARVNTVHISEISSRSVHLKWKWSHTGEKIVVKFRVNISEVRLNATHWYYGRPNAENFDCTIGHPYILPVRQYIMKFQCIPVVNNQEAGDWSDPVDLNFTSSADVPDALPRTTSGGFFVASNGKVRFFWQPVEESLRNGNITNNLVTVSGRYVTLTMNAPSSETSVELDLEPGYDYSVDVRSRTEIGYNDLLKPTPVYILLSPVTVKPNISDLAVILNGTSPYASWNSTGTVSGYTFFMCRKDTKEQMCGEPLQWQNTSDNVMRLPISNELMSDYRFGLSAEVDDPKYGRISSGLNWIECVYNDSETRLPEIHHEYIEAAEVTINLTWSLPQCIASNYQIRYWDVENPQKAISKTVGHRTYLMNGLEPHIVYHVEVRSWSENGELRSRFCDRCVVHHQVVVDSKILLLTKLMISCLLMVLLLFGFLIVLCSARFKKKWHVEVLLPPEASLTDKLRQCDSLVGRPNSYVRADEATKIDENHNEGKTESCTGPGELDKTVNYSEIKGVLFVQKKAPDDRAAKPRRSMLRILPEIPELSTEDQDCNETGFCNYTKVARDDDDDDEEDDDVSTSSECGDDGTTATRNSSEKSSNYHRIVNSHVTDVCGVLELFGNTPAPIEYVIGSDVSTDDGLPQSPSGLQVGGNVGNRLLQLSFQDDSPYVAYPNLHQPPSSSSMLGQTVPPLSSPDEGIDSDNSPTSSGLYCFVQMNDGSL